MRLVSFLACAQYYELTVLLQEANKSEIEMIGDHPRALVSFLEFLYTGEYLAPEPCEISPAAFHLHVKIIAEKYGCEPLVTDATANINDWIIVQYEPSEIRDILSDLSAIDHPFTQDAMLVVLYHHLEKLLPEQEFRDWLFAQPELMHEMLKDATILLSRSVRSRTLV